MLCEALDKHHFTDSFNTLSGIQHPSRKMSAPLDRGINLMDKLHSFFFLNL